LLSWSSFFFFIVFLSFTFFDSGFFLNGFFQSVGVGDGFLFFLFSDDSFSFFFGSGFGLLSQLLSFFIFLFGLSTSSSWSLFFRGAIAGMIIEGIFSLLGFSNLLINLYSSGVCGEIFIKASSLFGKIHSSLVFFLSFLFFFLLFSFNFSFSSNSLFFLSLFSFSFLFCLQFFLCFDLLSKSLSLSLSLSSFLLFFSLPSCSCCSLLFTFTESSLFSFLDNHWSFFDLNLVL